MRRHKGQYWFVCPAVWLAGWYSITRPSNIHTPPHPYIHPTYVLLHTLPLTNTPVFKKRNSSDLKQVKRFCEVDSWETFFFAQQLIFPYDPCITLSQQCRVFHFEPPVLILSASHILLHERMVSEDFCTFVSCPACLSRTDYIYQSAEYRKHRDLPDNRTKFTAGPLIV